MNTNFNRNFSAGAELAFRVLGIIDEREKRAWMEKLYTSQLETEGLRRTQLGQQITLGETQLEELKRKSVQEQKARGIIESTFQPESGDFPVGSMGITPTKEWYEQRYVPGFMQAYPTEFHELAKNLYKGEEGKDYEIITDPTTGSLHRVKKFGPEGLISGIKGKVEEREPTWKTIKEAISVAPAVVGKIAVGVPTKGGYTYKYLDQTEAEKDPDAYKFSQALNDAKKTEQTPLFMEKLSEAEQQRAEARLRIKAKSNYLAREGNPQKFDLFWNNQGMYGAERLDIGDITKLKEFESPDEAISHVERAYRANMISNEVRDQATTLINQNRKKWNDWRLIK